MFCKIFFSTPNKSKDLENYISKIKSDFRLITNNELIKQFFQKQNAKTFVDIFPEISSDTKYINKISYENILKYRKELEDVKFRGFTIFDGIEQLMFEEFILIERTKKIFEARTNVIFIFDKFSFTCFLMLKIANDYGYDLDNELKIGEIKKNGIKYITPQKNFSKLELIKKLRVTKAQVGIQRVLYAGIRVALNFFLGLNLNYEKILHRVDKKTEIKKSNFVDEVGFFFASDRSDFLKPSIEVIKKLERNKKSYRIFTFDLMTSTIMGKSKIPFYDFFENVYLLTDIIKKSQEGQRIVHKIKQISIEKNLLMLFNENFSAFFEEQIFHSMAILSILDRIFEKTNLHHIVIAIDGSMVGNLTAVVSKKYNLPSLSIESFFINENVERLYLYKADIISIYGLQGKNVLLSLGYEDKKIIVNGNPIYDYIKSINENSSTLSILPKTIVIVMSRWHKSDDEWISKLIQFCNKKNYNLIIKIHPIYKNQRKEENEIMVNSINKFCKNLKYEIIFDIEISTLLTNSDLVVTDFSNIGIEAILMEKPLIVVNFTKEDYSNAIKFYEYDAAIYTEKYNELEQLIIEILEQNLHKDKLKIGIKKISDEFNYHNDGKASERIIQILTEIREP